MTKRSPDKREQTRLKKVENENQRKRYLAADYVMRGKSLREAAKKVGRSTFFVMEWRDRLLDRKTVRKPVKGGLVTVVTYSWKKGYKDFLKTRKPGPEPGNCPKTQAIMDAVVEQKEKPFCKNIGARKIGIMSGVDASAPTVLKALKAAGYPPVRRQAGKHTKRYCRPAANDQWNIDFVEIGVDRITGKKIESLSVTDDHSRFTFSSDATISATTDHVISVLEGLFRMYGVPRRIRSDHGSQWYSSASGECRFDMWCDEWGIRHDMAPIRTPECNGKVERYHGCLRTEAALPKEGTVEEYQGLLQSYRAFFNHSRPHCSLGYRTPAEVYNKTIDCEFERKEYDRLLAIC